MAMLVSVGFGFAWHTVAILLLGGGLSGLAHRYLIAGGCAGIVAGAHTLWSRNRNDGRESVPHGIVTYYVGIFTYWIAIVVVERIHLFIQMGRWSNFNLRDNLNLIWIFLAFGTLPWGILLIPLNFATRAIVWRAYCGSWRDSGVATD